MHVSWREVQKWTGSHVHAHGRSQQGKLIMADKNEEDDIMEVQLERNEDEGEGELRR